MALSIVQQSAVGSVNAQSSLTLTFASTALAGSTLVVFAVGDGTIGPAPAGWTAVAGSPATGFCDLSCFYLQDALGLETSVTCTQASAGIEMYFYEIAGATTSGGPDTVGIVNSAAESAFVMIGPTVTTTVADAILLACYGIDNTTHNADSMVDGLFTFDGSFQSTGLGVKVSLNVGHLIVSSVGSYTPQWHTVTGSSTNDAVMVVAFDMAPVVATPVFTAPPRRGVAVTQAVIR